MFLIQKGQPAKPICREHRVAGVCQKCAVIRREAIEQARQFAREIEDAKAVSLARLG